MHSIPSPSAGLTHTAESVIGNGIGLVDQMIRIAGAESDDGEEQWRVLVVDDVGMRILSHCLRISDVMEENITVVERLDLARQPITSLSAIYFVAPVEESVQKIIDDFPARASKRLYRAAHLFFTSTLPDNLLKMIRENQLVKHVESLVELNIDFLAIESSTYLLDRPNSFYNLFSPESSGGAAEQELIARQLLTLCSTLNESPYIRYATTGSDVCKPLAMRLSAHLERFFSGGDVKPNASRATLLIVDRTIDMIAPLLNEFTYQAMIYSLLPIQNDRFKYVLSTGEKKEVIIGEMTDPIWASLRHLHITKATDRIVQEFNDFASKNKGAAFVKGKGKVFSLQQMHAVLKDIPNWQEGMSKYTMHYNLAGDCCSEFQKRDLMRIGYLEQSMATGEDAQGNDAKNLVSQLAPILGNRTLPLVDKQRLVMLYIVSQEGIKEQDRGQLMRISELPADQQAPLFNLKHLGISLEKGSRGRKAKKHKKKKHQIEEEVPFELSRFVPRLKLIMDDLATGTLSKQEFPYVNDPSQSSSKSAAAASSTKSGLRKAKPSWAEKKKGVAVKGKQATSTAANRLIVFVVGGITHSETRSAYEVAKRRGVSLFIGSTHIHTPSSFVQQVGSLKSLGL